MVVLFQLLALPCFTAVAVVVANYLQVQLVEMAAVETALHQAVVQAELPTEAAVAVAVVLLAHQALAQAAQAAQELSLLAL
jgi:hypothetical protein